MMQKYLKILLSSVLALSMILMPESTTFAESTADLQQNQSGITASSNSVSADVNYDEVKKIADQKARTLTTLYGENSVQYALIDNGKIVLSGQGGYSSKESKEQPTDNTMYGIGSVSKIFTVAAIMQLVEQGKLSLDTPVVHYIPEFTMADPRYKNITVRMLINHSSGILGTTAENTCLFDDYGDCTTNLLDELKTQRLKADPGEFSVYCNDGFTLAGILIEKVTGLSYTEYLKQNISIPLNLNKTKTYQDTFLNNNLAKLYKPGSNVLPTETLQIISAGGIYSSAVDLCKFAELFMNNSTSKVLSASSVSQMAYKEYLSPLWPDEGNSLFDYGLGWDCVDLYPFNQYGIKA
jgi:CubicO group peptidase (beta-lactamase class C family)